MTGRRPALSLSPVLLVNRRVKRVPEEKEQNLILHFAKGKFEMTVESLLKTVHLCGDGNVVAVSNILVGGTISPTVKNDVSS